MPTLKKINREAGTSFRRWAEVGPAMKAGQEAMMREGETATAAHDLRVTWDASSATVASRRGGEKALWVEGRATGDVLTPRVYLAANGNLVFLPSRIDPCFDKYGTPSAMPDRWGNRTGVKLDGKPVEEWNGATGALGTVAVNGEVVGNLRLSISSPTEWQDAQHDHPNAVAQGRVEVSREYMAKVARECGKRID